MARGGRPTQEAAPVGGLFHFQAGEQVAYWQILFQTVCALQVPVATG
jgi:hypothetical protein